MQNKHMPAAWIIAVVLFMELLDSTIINTSLPQMAISLGVSEISLKTAITSYLIALAVFIPISGWLADRFGTKKIFSLSIIIFTLSSLFCGLSNNIMELTIFRVLQGVGGAMMTPVGRLIVVRSFSHAERVKVMGYITIPPLFGPILGPVLGGFITTYYSWHWIFFINIPVGIISFILAQKYIQNEKATSIHPLDKRGFILTGAGLCLVSFGFENLSEDLISKSIIIFILFLGLSLLILYYFYSRNKKNTLLNLNLFKTHSFFVANLQIIISLVSMAGMSFLLPILFQTQFNMTPLQSGFMTLPIAAGALTIKPFVPNILKKYGFKKVLILNPILSAISLLLFTLVNDDNMYLIISVGFFFGIWYSMQLTAMNVLGYRDIDSENQSNSTSLQGTVQQFSMSLGVCLSALLLHTFLPQSGIDITHSTNSTNIISSFHNCFIAMGIICLLNSIVPFLLTKHEGAFSNDRNTETTNNSPKPILKQKTIA